MTPAPKRRWLRFSLTQLLASIFWASIGIAAMLFIFNQNAGYQHQTTVLAVATIAAYLGIGAAFGATVGAICGRQLRFTIAGLIAWPMGTFAYYWVFLRP